ncbi:hypothetical protein CKO51_01845 [Rhodopirellula sp. SM50]|nr:hypothetical protein [Rhodopirellula sp. SM50]PAY21346.1 hypothetical protein CKO51_01845 [Rhodopirellula sp. SM50]
MAIASGHNIAGGCSINALFKRIESKSSCRYWRAPQDKASPTASSDKKVRKDQNKREKAKREAARQKRRQRRRQANHSSDSDQFVDSAHENLFASGAGILPGEESLSDVESDAGNPGITAWWNRYMEADGSQRLSMVREKLSEELDAEWREALFPEAVFECETCYDASDYVGLLETLASDHRDLYETGLLWFLRSRVSHYLSAGNTERIDDAVSQDAAAMKETDDADAIKRLESVLEENNANRDEDVVLLRAEMIRRLTGKTNTKWVPNQLLARKIAPVRIAIY